MVLIGFRFRPRSLLTLILLAVFVLVVFDTARTWYGHPTSVGQRTWAPLLYGDRQSDHHSWQPGNSADAHPIDRLMVDAWKAFDRYELFRSMTFKEAVQAYRVRHGRPPPPGYKDWYKFAREKNVYNIDDFDQINDDMRPFWAVPPAVIRNHAAHSVDDPSHGNSILAVRNGHVYLPNEHWRPEAFINLLHKVARYLPDMDIPLNNLDQPRVIVPWDELQRMLKIEEASREDRDDMIDQFTKGMSNYWVPSATVPDRSWWHWFGLDRFHNELAVPAAGNDPAPDYAWEDHRNQQYMGLCVKGCPPASVARRNSSQSSSLGYTSGVFVSNFNLSSDICTVGPLVSELHGMMYASTSMLSTSKLVPIFSECKVSINNDILYPANMYYKQDRRYEYAESADISWEQKKELMLWRGVTAGGTTHAEEGDKWKQMHRQRFVLYTNSTELGDHTTNITALADPKSDTSGYSMRKFRPAPFAEEYVDTGFTEKQACIPDCSFYDTSISMVKQMSFAETFRSKFLVDVDGMSFSGRWRAFLQSRSLGIKNTIFREWHDSRLFAWKHFVPMDHKYEDLYSLLAYFIGLDQQGVRVPQHDAAAHAIAQEGREWAAKVLRREDIEIYTYRLLLEYGRIIDDNRDNIGVVDEDSEEMAEFDRRYPAVP